MITHDYRGDVTLAQVVPDTLVSMQDGLFVFGDIDIGWIVQIARYSSEGIHALAPFLLALID